jgi:hypothetical protein
VNNEHAKAYQNFTLLTAVAAGNEWTIAEANQLKDMRKAGIPVSQAAIILGRTFYAVQTYLAANGLTKAHKHPQTTKPIIACSNCNLIHTYECEF